MTVTLLFIVGSVHGLSLSLSISENTGTIDCLNDNTNEEP